jgi:sigma-E factor negative regulatory protein RseB
MRAVLYHRPSTRLRALQVFALACLATLVVSVRAESSDCESADSEALRWLDKMSKSLREVSYQGVVMLQRGGDMQVMQVSHAVGHGSSSERLTKLTGRGAQVERGAHPLDCVHPGYQMLRLESLPESERCGIAAHYRFSIDDGERVAGRTAVRIRIMPRDMYRFGYVLALDTETGLLLKSQTIGQDHRTLETMQFAQVSYTDVAPPLEHVAVIHQAEHPRSDRASTRLSVGRAWQVGWLPRGFAATDSAQGIDARRTYTDGLAVFSVFLEELDAELRAGEGTVTQGGTTTFTRGMQVAGRPVLVTVIGEVPLNTARIVADSVSWTQ